MLRKLLQHPVVLHSDTVLPCFVFTFASIVCLLPVITGVDFRRVEGARVQRIRHHPSGDLDPRRLLRFQSQAGRTGGTLGELGHPQLGGNRHLT